MRTIIYGDIHGCLDELKELRELLKITPNDKEYSVGDVLDRGPKSAEALRYVRDKNIEMILGNHEYKYLRYFRREIECKHMMGAINSVKLEPEQIEVYKTLNEDDFAFLQTLPFFRKLENIVIIHGGLPPNTNLAALELKKLEISLWLRTIDKDTKLPLGLYEPQTNAINWASDYDGTQGFVIYGHAPIKEVRLDKFAVGIDTSCVFGGKLTAAVMQNLNPDTLNFASVNAHKTYAELKKFD